MSLSDEIDRIEASFEAVAGPMRVPSYSERIEDNLVIIGRILEKLEQNDKIKARDEKPFLEKFMRDLGVLKWVPDEAALDSLEADFCSLLSVRPNLLRAYMAFTEEDFIAILSDKLQSIQDLSKQRLLSDDELRIMQEINEKLQKSRDALREYMS